MPPATLDYLTQPIPVERRSGPGLATPLTLTADYDDDPVLAVRLGHPLAEIGFAFLLRDLFQAALAPRNNADWVRRLATPPTPAELETALTPYRDAFIIDHPVHPALQVRPSAERLAEAAAGKPAKGKKRPAKKPAAIDTGGDDEGEDLPAGLQPIATLLPDSPTGEAVKQDTDFFTRRGGVTAIGAGAILPVLYAHMVLFPPGGGGYLSLPHRADSIKYQMAGHTLWETIWLNVLTQQAQGMGESPWPAPADASVFPWLDRALASMPLGRNDDGAARALDRPRLHPAHIPLPRRYLLVPPVAGRCGLTGLEGPVFTGYSRWPKGLAYQRMGWWMPSVSRIDTPDDADKPPGFVRARGPLRFDDWLETALFKNGPPEGRNSAPQRLLPPVLEQFHSALNTHPAAMAAIARRHAGGTPSATALTGKGAFRVCATAQYFYGKPVGGLSQREMPVSLLPAQDLAWIGATVAETLETVAAMATVLYGSAARAAAFERPKPNGKAAADGGGGKKKKSIALAAHLRDGLLADLDALVLDAPARLARAAEQPDEEERRKTAGAVQTMIRTAARRTALTLFDQTFPIDGTLGTDSALAQERAALVRRLHAILHPKPSKQGAS